MIIVIGGRDLRFRPKSYFWPLNLETHLRATVRGRERRAKCKGHTPPLALPKAGE